MRYSYVAKDERSKTVTGNVESLNEKTAVLLLKEKGFLVISLAKDEKNKGVERFLSFLKKVSLNDRVNFTLQISTMLSSGLTLSQSLALFTSQLKPGLFKEIVSEISKNVEVGVSFSEALSKFEAVFPPTYLSLVKAGEASGNLDVVLTRLADTLEKQRDFRAKVKGALIYPAIISVAMVGVFILIIVFVVPKLTSMYSSLNIELPLPTKIMIGLSDFFITKWYLVILIAILISLGFNYYKKSKAGKYQLAKMSLRLPIFGKINKEKELTEFARTLSLLISAGVPIVESLNISSKAVSNVLYIDAIKASAQKVEKGTPLSETIALNAIFPPIVSQMINVGQETGKMDEVLGKLSLYFENEVDRKLKNLSVALEPLIMMVLGLMVGVLILSIITPIYKLTSSF
ncbi:hypothetical protein AUJ94_00370 [bacterium CG2_30_40_12]|nr:MAG: hypothetical protein AUJ94_00370 [bacterium CG2_30_40_12]PJE51520.1 MAG: hypothetical protein COV27_01950 [candidate division WWE3 bacterium CG10_big_fil_rev_8_21_14_0_10_39_14]